MSRRNLKQISNRFRKPRICPEVNLGAIPKLPGSILLDSEQAGANPRPNGRSHMILNLAGVPEGSMLK